MSSHEHIGICLSANFWFVVLNKLNLPIIIDRYTWTHAKYPINNIIVNTLWFQLSSRFVYADLLGIKIFQWVCAVLQSYTSYMASNQYTKNGSRVMDLSWYEETNTTTMAKFADCTRIPHNSSTSVGNLNF